METQVNETQVNEPMLAALLNLKDSIRIVLEDQLDLLELKESVNKLIENYKKNPGFDEYKDLKNKVYTQVMISFYGQDTINSLYELM